MNKVRVQFDHVKVESQSWTLQSYEIRLWLLVMLILFIISWKWIVYSLLGMAKYHTYTMHNFQGGQLYCDDTPNWLIPVNEDKV